MRRIKSKKEESKKEKRNQIILVTILVVVLLGSTFGVVVNSFGNSNNEENEINYQGNEFIYQNGFWIFEVEEFVFYFLNTPYETEGVVVKNNVSKKISDYYNVPVYIYSENSDAEIEIYRNLYSLAERIQETCVEGIECSDETLPVKTCENNLIIIQESETNEVIQRRNCVYIYGEKENLIKTSDEFLFRLLNIK